MSKNPDLNEIEEYEREVTRARAENRVPVLKDPRVVFSENLGNSDTLLVELTDEEIKTAEDERQRQLDLREENSQRIMGVIKDSGSTHDTIEMDALLNADRINLTEEGQVMGDSVNPTAGNESTADDFEAEKREQDNAVPAHEKAVGYDDPRPQVVEQTATAASFVESGTSTDPLTDEAVPHISGPDDNEEDEEGDDGPDNSVDEEGDDETNSEADTPPVTSFPKD
jgi:hypothetical protein